MNSRCGILRRNRGDEAFEADERRLQAVQKPIDRHIEEVDDHLNAKEHEILAA